MNRFLTKDELVGEMRLPNGMFIRELALTKLPGAEEALVAMQSPTVEEGSIWVFAAFNAYAEAHNMTFKEALNPAVLEMMERMNEGILGSVDTSPQD